MSNENFIEFVFSTFVDYSSLNKYYGKAAKIILANHNNKEITELINGIINATKILKPGGKVKLTGNTIKGKTIPKYIEKFLNGVKKAYTKLFKKSLTPEKPIRKKSAPQKRKPNKKNNKG